MANGQLELSLFGQKIRLKHKAANGEDPVLAEQIVKLVQKKVKEAEARTPSNSAPHHVAVMALLDLAAEYLQAKARTEDYMGDLDRKSEELLSLLANEKDLG